MYFYLYVLLVSVQVSGSVQARDTNRCTSTVALVDSSLLVLSTGHTHGPFRPVSDLEQIPLSVGPT